MRKRVHFYGYTSRTPRFADRPKSSVNRNMRTIDPPYVLDCQSTQPSNAQNLTTAAGRTNTSTDEAVSGFIPTEPKSFAEAGVTETQGEALVLRYLLAHGNMVGHFVAEQVHFRCCMVDA